MSLRRLALRLAHAAVDTSTILDNLVWSRRELTRRGDSQRAREPQVRPWPAVVGIGENGLAGLDRSANRAPISLPEDNEDPVRCFTFDFGQQR